MDGVTADRRPQVTLSRLTTDLGSTLLKQLAGQADDRQIRNVVIHDPLDLPLQTTDTLVLGIGLESEAQISELVTTLTKGSVGGLIVRSSDAVTDRVKQQAEDAGVCLLGLSRGASWMHVLALLRSALVEDSMDQAFGGRAASGGSSQDDLFSLANAITALLDAPVTIEDRNSRVIAFSARQDEADEARIASILGRSVPEGITRVYQDTGVFRELLRTDEPVWLDRNFDGLTQMPRVAIAVRAGDEFLGSIWAAVREPLNDVRTEALKQAAHVVALHMLQLRVGADVERRLRIDRVASAISGSGQAREELVQLGLSGVPIVLIALEVIHGSNQTATAGGTAARETERQRIDDALELNLKAVDPRCVSARVGDTTFALVPVDRAGPGGGQQRVVRIGKDFLRRLGQSSRVLIAVGPPVEGALGLAQSRSTVDRVLRVLRGKGSASPQVACLEDVHFESLLLELQDIAFARGEVLSGPLARLQAYDQAHDADFVVTLGAWLDAFGDVRQAATVLNVHPNTLRYRMGRISEVGAVDLSDPDARLAAILQIRLGIHSAASPMSS